MAALSNLPNETLLNIFAHLSGEARTLARICLVSHKLGTVAIEILYDNVTASRYSRPLFVLARTLLERPDLRVFVTKFSGRLILSNYEFDLPKGEATIDLELIGRFAQHLDRYFDLGWTREIMHHIMDNMKDGSTAGCAALILTLLPNIHTLDFRLKAHSDNDDVYDRPVDALFGWDGARYTAPNQLPQLSRSPNGLRPLQVPIKNLALGAFFELAGLRTLEIDFMDKWGEGSLPIETDCRLPPTAVVLNIQALKIRTAWRDLDISY